MRTQILLNNQKSHMRRSILPLRRKDKRSTLSIIMYPKVHKGVSLMTMLIAPAQIIWCRAKSKYNHKIVCLLPILSTLAKIAIAKTNWSLWFLKAFVSKLRALAWDTLMSQKDLSSFLMASTSQRCSRARPHSSRVTSILIIWLH